MAFIEQEAKEKVEEIDAKVNWSLSVSWSVLWFRFVLSLYAFLFPHVFFFTFSGRGGVQHWEGSPGADSAREDHGILWEEGEADWATQENVSLCLFILIRVTDLQLLECLSSCSHRLLTLSSQMCLLLLSLNLFIRNSKPTDFLFWSPLCMSTANSLRGTFFHFLSQMSNLMNQARLKVLKARDDMITVRNQLLHFYMCLFYKCCHK